MLYVAVVLSMVTFKSSLSSAIGLLFNLKPYLWKKLPRAYNHVSLAWKRSCVKAGGQWEQDLGRPQGHVESGAGGGRGEGQESAVVRSAFWKLVFPCEVRTEGLTTQAEDR